MVLPSGFAQDRGSFQNMGQTDKTFLPPLAPSLSFRSSLPVFASPYPSFPFIHLEVGFLNPAMGSEERCKLIQRSRWSPAA